MIIRGLFVRSISKLQFDEAGERIQIDFDATEINRQNSKAIFAQYGTLHFHLATLLSVQRYENFNERLQHFFIADGKTSAPLIFTIMTEQSSLTIGLSWFDKNSPISYEQVVEVMYSLYNDRKARILMDGVNYLMHGE